MSLKLVLPLFVLGTLLFIGCNVDMHEEGPTQITSSNEDEGSIPPPIGGRCIVKYRPDACAADSPVAADTIMSNGIDFTLSGTLLAVDDDWIVLEVNENGKYEYWVPREDVFFIRAARPRETPENASQEDSDHATTHDSESTAETSGDES